MMLDYPFGIFKLFLILTRVILSHHHTLLRKHRVGKWQIKHIIPNVDAIVDFLSPIYKKQLMIFFGMINSYSMFCFNLGTIDHPRDQPRVSRVEQELITIPVHLQFLVEFVLLYL
jgi:hypothetical protein